MHLMCGLEFLGQHHKDFECICASTAWPIIFVCLLFGNTHSKLSFSLICPLLLRDGFESEPQR